MEAHKDKVTLIARKRNPSESGSFDEPARLINYFFLIFVFYMVAKSPLSKEHVGFYVLAKAPLSKEHVGWLAIFMPRSSYQG